MGLDLKIIFRMSKIYIQNFKYLSLSAHKIAKLLHYQDYLATLDTVLTRLQEAGLCCIKQEKCYLMLPSVEYQAFKISAAGLQPTTEKAKVVHEAPEPKDITRLKAFLGLVNYYGHFLPDLSTVLAPLYRLLKKDSTWMWREPQMEAFQTVKTSDCTL